MDEQRSNEPDQEFNEELLPDAPPEHGERPGTEADEAVNERQDDPRDAKHSEDRVDEWGDESFPASDPPESWAGKDFPPA